MRLEQQLLAMANAILTKPEPPKALHRNFRFEHCHGYGLPGTFWVVKYGTQRIGRIEDSEKADFIAGNNRAFQPVKNWRTQFGPELRKMLGLNLNPLKAKKERYNLPRN